MLLTTIHVETKTIGMGVHNPISFLCFGLLRQGFPVSLEAVLELALMDQAGLELTEICLPLPPEYWD